MNITLRLEEPADCSLVEHLTREAFWDVYHPGCSEHLILHKLRTHPDFIAALNFVALVDGQIVGHIAYSRSYVLDEQGNHFETLTFGPLSVLPAFQHAGVGKLLIRHTVELAKTMACKAIIIFGNPAFYHRFGFENAQKFGITTAEGQNFDAFMALELFPDSLAGVSGQYFVSEAFDFTPKELEEFDRQFPPKEKHITDTQLN